MVVGNQNQRSKGIRFNSGAVPAAVSSQKALSWPLLQLKAMGRRKRMEQARRPAFINWSINNSDFRE
jgi:hypothetical protein